VYMYEGDAPLAERRVAALALDRDLLRDLLGADELRELLDPAVIAELELELQRLAPGRRARHADDLHDLLADLGPLDAGELRARCESAPDAWLDALIAERRVILAGGRYAAVEDAARLRDALGLAIPAGLPTAFTDPVPRPLDDLVARYARTHVPFLVDEVVARLGVTAERALEALTRLESAGRVVHGEFRPGGAEREWCDAGVLRAIRRRSLAALRHEVEPVDATTFARFLTRWHGIGRGRRGTEALVEVLEQLQGVAVPVSVLERDVLPARVDGYRPAMLDELCAAGEIVWIGAGALGADDGRVRLFFRDRIKVLAPSVVAPDPPAGPVHDALREHLARAGASFWPDLVAATGTADDAVVLTALWDLVWAGEVTNDTFGPLRVPRRAASRRSARSRPHPGRLARLGPPAGAGRWSLVGPLVDPPASPTEVAHATALQLLERHGVLTREAVKAESTPGGFSAVYPVLRALEESGRARRGWFVAGLGAAQFALPGAVDRLRDRRNTDADDPGRIAVLAATDPAQPYGAALAWPERAGPSRPSRAAGAHVVLVDGACAAYVERGGRALMTFAAPAGGAIAAEEWAGALAAAHKEGRIGRLQLERIDDEPARTSPHAPSLRAAGFADGYRGLTLHE
jgi:ATP-dependent helicase Lhr and Lhr-like helicase